MTDRWNPDFAAGNPMLTHLPFPHFPDWPAHEDYGRMLRKNPIANENGRTIRFVEPQKADYETRIFETGEISTRPRNWHDFFNALVWLHFPKTKSRINALHYRECSAPRNALANALTHFDESGVIVLSSRTELAEDLRSFRWKELFWEKRELVEAGMSFLIFGHGLLEKTMHPYIGMTGQGIVLETDDIHIGNGRIDEILSGRLASLSSPADLCPVPLLGYPGWDSNNSDPAYYDNENYFRKGRRQSSSSSSLYSRRGASR
ncbi:MAG: DUF3025 domain-containing protein [Burkholderiales bacterium]|nr:DUF3025 domain-containing protein [Burkholderiales bacterium]